MRNKIVKRFLEWVVTTDGLSYTGTNVTSYDIPKSRLLEKGMFEHVMTKTFVIREDFEAAYLAAVEYHYPNR